MSISRQNFILLAVESIAIFLSVLLAFFVEEWRDDRREIRQMHEALAVISEELSANADQINTALPYHRESLPIVTQQVADLAGGGDFPSGDAMRFANAPVLSTAAYSMAVSTGALERAPTDALIDISVDVDFLDIFQSFPKAISQRKDPLVFRLHLLGRNTKRLTHADNLMSR